MSLYNELLNLNFEKEFGLRVDQVSEIIKLVEEKLTPTDTDVMPLLCKVHQYIMNSPLQRDYTVSDHYEPMEQIAQQQHS